MGVLFFDTGAFQVFEQDGSGANNASATSSTGAFTLGAWHHFAAVKHGTDLLLFLDGVQVASTTSAVRSSFPGYMRIGRLDTGGGEFPFAGYVDDFRVTKGVARYVANFTPPVAPFPDA